MPIFIAALPRITALCLSLFLLAGCSPESSEQEVVSAPAVEGVEARRGALPLVERLSGTVRAENQVALHAQLPGRITQVLVESGQHVTSGQALVVIDESQASEQVRQAEAGFRIAEARVRQSKARLVELQAQATRTRELGRRDLVADLELETMSAQVESAQADVDLVQAQRQQAAATLAEQRALLAQATVRAPIDGVVGRRNAEVGMQVSSTVPLFAIGNLDRMLVRVDLTDVMLRRVQPGDRVTLSLVSHNGEPRRLEARLTRISPFLDDVTRTTEGEIEIDNQARWLTPGMFVAVDIAYGETRQGTLVPASALYLDPNTGREGVFVVQGRSDSVASKEGEGRGLSAPVPVEFRSVPVIARGSGEVAVGSLEPGDWVVTVGHDLLSTGRTQARVRAVTWEHVSELQQAQREDLLGALLDTATPTP